MTYIGRKVLIVEDDADARTLLREHLKRAGYSVIAAEDGEEGLKKFREDKPDLVILDVVMPRLDGWEVLQRLKAGFVSRKVPVIMLTGKDTDQDKSKGYEHGAEFYIGKPYNMEKLLTVVKSVFLKKGR